jgi:hypothetical protein
MGMEPTVLQQVAALRKMPLEALRQRWRALFGADAPGYSAEHMVRRLAYRLQELRYGGLADAAREKLAQTVEETGAAGAGRSARRKRKAVNMPAPGTRLVREWRGKRHEVTVCHDGTFEYAGNRFRTLSAVAKAISGQHCSGPRFFGLAGPGKSQRSEDPHGEAKA